MSSKIWKSGFLVLAVVLASTYADSQVPPGSGVQALPPITANHCAKFANVWQIQDAGAACGAGTITSISNSDGTLTLSPSPIIASGSVSLNLAHANTWTATQTFTPAANTGAMVVSGYSLTGSNTPSMLDLSGTLNTSGAADVVKLAVTVTSGSSANILEIFGGASGTTKFFGITAAGVTTVPNGNFAVGPSDGAQLRNAHSGATVATLNPNQNSNDGIGGASNHVTVVNNGATTADFTSSTIAFPIVTTGTNADFACFSSGEVLTLQSSACTISSLRFKENVKPFTESAIGEILKFTTWTYNMRAQVKPNRDPNFRATQIGLTAENIAKVDPRCAIYENDMRTPKSYRQECVIALLVKSSQQEQQEIINLKSKIAMLSRRKH